MQDQFQIFEAVLERRRRGGWKWFICSAEGEVILRGFDMSRPAARYSANRALLQLLLYAPYRSKAPKTPTRASFFGLGRTRSPN
jgi:hypothetical protein